MIVSTELDADEWRRPTACSGWSVRDVALHLLGNDIGCLSGGRDGHRNPEFGARLDIGTFAGLISAIDQQNEAWVSATRWISPQLAVQLLTFSGDPLEPWFRAMDLDEVVMPIHVGSHFFCG